MNLNDAAAGCRGTGLEGWELAAYAQKLVSRQMRYSVENSLDTPAAAFEKGRDTAGARRARRMIFSGS